MTRKLWTVPAGLAFFSFLAQMGFSQPRGYHDRQGMMGWGHGWGWLGVVLMVILCLAVIIGIIALIRWLWTGAARRGIDGGQSHLDILKTRYARGEIDKEEFEEKKKDLSS